MKALVFEKFGEPSQVLQLRDVPTPEPGPGQVRVRMISSPVNPSDLLVVRGRYGVLPAVPATPGFEGVGVVDKAGPGLLGRFVVGKRVCVINSQGGNWAEYAIIPARQARPVPSDIPDDQVASFFVNPATVLAMIRHVLQVKRGSWLAQSAANSALGRMVIRLARRDGFRTVNVVRREDLRSELEALGADAVVIARPGEAFSQEIRRVTGGGVPCAIDPVGGQIGSELARSLAPEGRLLVYGSLSEEPLQIESRRLIAYNTRLEGFWLGHWMRSRNIPQSLSLFREIARGVREGTLATSPSVTFASEEYLAALQAAEQPGHLGKALLKFS